MKQEEVEKILSLHGYTREDIADEITIRCKAIAIIFSALREHKTSDQRLLDMLCRMQFENLMEMVNALANVVLVNKEDSDYER